MIDATILWGRPRDLTCLGRSCTGQLTPRPRNLMASLISV